MDVITLGLGVVIILYGIYTLVARIKSPEKFGKLVAMKEKFGNGVGTAIHTFAYTFMPVAFGSIVVAAGINGISIAEFMAAR
ncbi:MAG: hypothetical protein V7785_10425 [Bermanella sp.]